MIEIKIIINKLKDLSRKMIISSFLSLIIAVGYFAHGAFSEPIVDPSASDQDFTENIIGVNSANNDFNSTSVVANADGSIIERLNYIKENLAGVDYSLQQHQIYDDLNCTNNNDDGTDSACAASDPEYIGEEGAWASTTDTDLNGSLVASGKIFQDERTGLYWSDCYDSTSGQGSCDSIDNDFDIWDDGGCTGNGAGTECTDADISNGLCNNSDYWCYDNDGDGSALDFCENLSLDADGDGTDETDWYLPSQKELMQAYINGAGNNLPNPSRLYWSASELYSSASNAWYVSLSYGSTYVFNKTNGNYARCVLR